MEKVELSILVNNDYDIPVLITEEQAIDIVQSDKAEIRIFGGNGVVVEIPLELKCAWITPPINPENKMTLEFYKVKAKKENKPIKFRK